MDVSTKSPAIGPYSVWRFRFWRTLTFVFHAAFLHRFFQAVDLGSSMVLATVVSAAISAVALRLYSLAARFLTSIENQKGLQAIIGVFVVLAFEMTVARLKNNTHGAAMIAFLTMSFVAYLRSVVSVDRTKMIQVFFVLSCGTASYFNKNGIDGGVYFRAASILAFLAMAIGRGFRAPNAGIFDQFLDILGNVD